AQLSGTLQDPRATATVSIVRGSAWQEPFDKLQAAFNYSNTTVNLSSFRLDSGPSNLTASGSFTHQPGDFQDGHVQFRAQSNTFQLGRFRFVHEARPGLAGTVELTADGAATLKRGAAPLIEHLNADLHARGLAVDSKPLGDLTATATTRGTDVVFDLT